MVSLIRRARDSASRSCCELPSGLHILEVAFHDHVTYVFVCVDLESGVLSCPGDLTVPGDGANLSFTVTATDTVGNVGMLTVVGSTSTRCSRPSCSQGSKRRMGWLIRSQSPV